MDTLNYKKDVPVNLILCSRIQIKINASESNIGIWLLSYHPEEEFMEDLSELMNLFKEFSPLFFNVGAFFLQNCLRHTLIW